MMLYTTNNNNNNSCHNGVVGVGEEKRMVVQCSQLQTVSFLLIGPTPFCFTTSEKRDGPAAKCDGDDDKLRGGVCVTV